MFQLDLKSRKSIYQQVMDNLKELIMTGSLKNGDKLPSVRDLSKQITVNPNTVQKAYKELERQGYIYTTTGVGTFVSDISKISVDVGELSKLKDKLIDTFKQILFLGLDFNSAKDLVMEILDGEEAIYLDSHYNKGGKQWLI